MPMLSSSIGNLSLDFDYVSQEGKQIPLTASFKSVEYLGSGYSLYFAFLKYCIGFLCVLLVISGMFNIITNYSSADCAQISNKNILQFCYQDYVTIFTIANKKDHKGLLNTQLILNLIAILAVLIFFYIMRYKFNKAIENLDRKSTRLNSSH
mgnify:FL=1